MIRGDGREREKRERGGGEGGERERETWRETLYHIVSEEKDSSSVWLRYICSEQGSSNKKIIKTVLLYMVDKLGIHFI